MKRAQFFQFVRKCAVPQRQTVALRVGVQVLSAQGASRRRCRPSCYTWGPIFDTVAGNPSPKVFLKVVPEC